MLRLPTPFLGPLGPSAGTLKVTRNAPGKLPDTPADTPGGGGRRLPPPRVLDSVSWNLPGRVLSHFEGPAENTPNIQGTPQIY